MRREAGRKVRPETLQKNYLELRVVEADLKCRPWNEGMEGRRGTLQALCACGRKLGSG